MVDKEMLKPIMMLIRNSYPGCKFFDDQLSFKMFVDNMQPFDYDEVLNGVKTYISTHDSYPSIAGIEAEVKNEHSIRTRAEQSKKPIYNFDPNQKTYRCKSCKDVGYITIHYKGEIDTIKPCSCDRGRNMFPWYFQGETERKEWITEQNRLGKHPAYDNGLWVGDKDEWNKVMGSPLSDREYEEMQNYKRAKAEGVIKK